MLDSGLTVQQIIQGQVEMHGETVLSAPTKNGFNLTAWMTPFAALLAGGFGVRKILGAWMKRKGQAAEGGPPETANHEPEVPNKYARRLQDEQDNIEL